jgi:enoyl-CoA hydratase/carnithine racemase
VGGGFSLALSCDVRIASETARFGAAQVARGLVPDYGMTYYLPLVIGVSRALELMFSGEIVGAVEAERLGIVSRVVPGDQLMKVAKELANKIAKQAPVPIGLTKRMVWRGLFDNLNRQIDLETWAQQLCFQTEDHKESVRAFLEKRPQPEFKGK